MCRGASQSEGTRRIRSHPQGRPSILVGTPEQRFPRLPDGIMAFHSGRPRMKQSSNALPLIMVCLITKCYCLSFAPPSSVALRKRCRASSQRALLLF